MATTLLLDYFPTSRASACAIFALTSGLVLGVCFLLATEPYAAAFEKWIVQTLPANACTETLGLRAYFQHFIWPAATYWILSGILLVADLLVIDAKGNCKRFKRYTKVDPKTFWAKYSLGAVLACVNFFLAAVLSAVIYQPLACRRDVAVRFTPRLTFFEMNVSNNSSSAPSGVWARVMSDLSQAQLSPEFFLQAALTIVAMSFLSDATFFFMHRFFHSTVYSINLYKHVHRLHHVFVQSVGVNAIACWPIEHALTNNPTAEVAGIVLGTMYLPLTWNTIWISFATVTTVLSHSGFKIGVLNEAHDAHHQIGTGANGGAGLEFGTAFVCDRFFGTDLRTYELEMGKKKTRKGKRSVSSARSD